MELGQGSFPQPFGKYRLLKLLARGGMGELYLAVAGDLDVEKICVIKTVLPDMADGEFLSRFRDEAKIVVRLTHGNIVPVFDAGVEGGRFYLAMEFVDGKDLRATWNRCAERKVGFPVDVSVHIIREVCRGLENAHNYTGIQLVHRDVSPPNVLISYAGEVKLADFGLATSSLKATETAPGIVYGKLSYMSPEQARGDALDGRSDTYAAGILLWEMLTGRRYLTAPPDRPQDLLAKVREPTFVPPGVYLPGLSPELDFITRRALEPNRDARFQTAEQMRAALAEFLARVAPTTDSTRLAEFLRLLFSQDIERERLERETLLRTEVSSVAVGRSKVGTKDPAKGGNQALAGDDASNLIGTVLDERYEVVRMIGEGGMGRVYQARHIEIDRRVAVKVLHPVYSHLPELASRFRREARAASRIGHAGIVDVTDSGTTPQGSLYFVMEYLEGIDLADVLAQHGQLPVERAIRIAVQICRAVGAAHEVGIVHRDLKPENVFLITRDGNSDFVKIVDFGIAKSTEIEEARSHKLTRPGMAMGTPEYMAPEQAAGKPADPRVDVYAVGAILYEMLAGRPPHSGDNMMEVLNRKATERPLPLSGIRSDVSADLDEAVLKVLAYDAEDRPQTMAQLEYLLNRCQRGRGAAVASLLGIGDERSLAQEEFGPLSREEAHETKRRGRRERIFVSVGAALALGAAIIVLWRYGAETPAKLPSQRPTEIVPVQKPVATAPALLSPEPAAVAPAAPALSEPVVSLPGRSPTISRAPSVEGESAGRKRQDGKRLIDDGNSHLSGGRLREAREAFQAALDRGSEKSAALAGLAAVAFQGGDFDGASRLATRAIAAGGGDNARMVLGDAYLRMGRYADAATQYAKILERDPTHRGAQRNLETARRRLER